MGNRLTDAIEKQLNRLMAYKEANTPKSTRPKASPARVIDQGLFGGAVSRIPDEANRLIQRAKAAPAELNALASPEMAQQVQQAMSNPQPANMQQWLDAGMELSGMAPLGGLMAHTVYHGSPHKFDKFDMSKIGTGEGAQAYGHGLYFAEAPEVAQTYGRATTPGSRAFNSITYNGQNFPAGSRDGELLYDITTKGRAAVIQNLQKQADRLATINPKESANLLNRIEYAKTIKPDNVQIDAGNLYKVDIPDESIPRMLDWDKPLSQQHPDVLSSLGFSNRSQDAINAEAEQLMAEGNKRAGKAGGWMEFPELKARYDALNNELDRIPPNVTGGQYYRGVTGNDYLHDMLNGYQGDASSSAEMMSKGIPGIRYLDGNSRGAGGTSNFVLFDDQLPRILEVNGVPTGAQPWAQDAIGLNGKPIDPRGKVRK